MKRVTALCAILLLCVFAVLFFPAKAQGQDSTIKAAVEKVDSATKRDYAQQVTAVIDHIAGKLEVPAKELYRVLAKQGFVEGISNIPWAILWLWIIWLYWRRLKRVFDLDATGQFRDDGERTGFLVVGAFVTLIFGAAAANCLANAIMYAINPEYFAIKTIFDGLRGTLR
jgi:hypothetical protein